MAIIGSPRSGGYPIAIHIAAVPSRYYLFQCIVSGFREYGYTSLNMYYRLVQAQGGRVSFVIEPALEANRAIYLWGVGAEAEHWTFGGCETTPFSP
jgi:hypothetical protein